MQLSNKFVYKVRAALTKKGTSLHKICRDNDIHTGNIYAALRGDLNSERAIMDRTIVIQKAFSKGQIKRMGISCYMTDLHTEQSENMT